MQSKKSAPFTGTIGGWAIGLGASVAVVAVLFAARQPQDKPLPQKAAASAWKAPASDVMLTKSLTGNATAPKAVVQQTTAVTITGCLERNDSTFRLKDTTGMEAPKSRSWKSGFLKKGSGSIDVVDGANKLKLPNYVGQRVSVTGMLVDREMQVRSLQRVAESCSKS